MSYETNKRVMDASVYKKEWTLMKKEKFGWQSMHVFYISAIRDYAFLQHHPTGTRFRSKNKNQMGWKTNTSFQ